MFSHKELNMHYKSLSSARKWFTLSILFFFVDVIFPIDFPIFKNTLCQVSLSFNRMFPVWKSSIYRVSTQPITITTENIYYNFQFIVSSCSLYNNYHVQIIVLRLFPKAYVKCPLHWELFCLPVFRRHRVKTLGEVQPTFLRTGNMNLFTWKSASYF